MKLQLTIIWAVLLFAQLVYLVVPAPPSSEVGTGESVFPLTLGAIAIAQAGAVLFVLRRRAFTPIAEGRLDPDGAGAGSLFTTLILAWVLSEAVAIYGLVLRFLQFERSITLPFAALAMALFFLARPWSPKLQKPASARDLARSNAPIR